jgi:Ca-activated chloride channel family protein
MSDLLHNLRFEQPWAFALLALLPLMAWIRGRAGRGAALQYSGLSLFGAAARQRQARPGALLAALRYLTLICLIVALARPQRVDATSQVQESGIDMMLAIDLSPSMQALDYHLNGQEISRVDLVRMTVGQFIDERPNDRIGMVAFAGQAYLMSPLTLDHDWLQENVQRLQVGLAGDATAIGSAIAVCCNRLRDQHGKSKIIVLLTDGANNAGKITPLAAAQAAKALGIKIYTIGAGSADVAKFPTRDPFTGARTYTTIPVDIDEHALQQIADLTGGKFFRAADADAMKNCYAAINKLETTRVATKRFEHVKEFFALALYPGLLFLGAELVLAHTRFRRVP